METNLVRVKEAVLVAPSEATPARVLTLSALDSQLFLRFTIEYLLVYQSGPCSDHGVTADRLKAALGRALVPYYPLAGRVRVGSNGSNLEVVCRAQGALFIEAVSDLTVADFGRTPWHVTEWRKLLSLQVADVLRGAPPMVMQLTWLADGGAALGFGINHCLCDGIGSVEFLNTLADLAAGERDLSEIKPKPMWDRHLLDPRPLEAPCRLSSYTHPEFNSVTDLSGFVARFSQEPLIPTSITFEKRSVNELKHLASSSNESSYTSSSNESSYTCFEVLSAHVWRSWARALNMPSNQTLKLLFSINIRNRIKPSLPPGYYGNAFVLGCAQTTVKEITDKGLGHVCGLVKRAKERVGDEYVRRVVDTVSGESGGSPDSVGVLILSQWSRLGLERVDFGMGRPVNVGPICSDKYCLFLPVSDQKDAVKVTVAVPTTAVDQYLHLIGSPYS